MDWPTVVSQSLPALAAILGALVTGLMQNRNRAGDREHELAIKKADDEKEEARLKREERLEHVKNQREAVRVFLDTTRGLQAKSVERYGDFRARQRNGDANFDFFEDTYRAAVVARTEMVQAWEVMDATLSDESLRSVSAPVGRALQESLVYSGTDIGLATEDSWNNPHPSFEDLLSDLREASARLLVSSGGADGGKV